MNGPELANEQVGGSEGLRRLRELIDDGYPIEARRHPSPARDIWQYRLTVQTDVSPIRRTEKEIVYLPNNRSILPPEEVDSPISDYKFEKPPRYIDFGEVAVCPRCHGRTQRYVFKGMEGKRHKDPTIKKSACVACNGWGIVPNKGPIAMTPPDR